MSKYNHPYTPLQWNRTKLSSKTFTWKDILLVLLGFSTTVLFVNGLWQHQKLSNDGSKRFAYESLGIDSDMYIQNYTWWSEYSSTNEQDNSVEQAWDKVVPAHGIVAVDMSWAKSKSLPDTMVLPSDAKKGVYVVDAYHQLHCLQIVRKTFYEILQKRTLTYPVAHATHCFDNFRQYIQCTAGDTLLYTWGKNITGDGQERKCRDWKALRDWASENSACYEDSVEPKPLLEHFGRCSSVKTDGLIIT